MKYFNRKILIIITLSTFALLCISFWVCIEYVHYCESIEINWFNKYFVLLLILNYAIILAPLYWLLFVDCEHKIVEKERERMNHKNRYY